MYRLQLPRSSFQYNRAVNFLHDNGYISDERYNLEIYGTNDEHKIQVLNLGLSSSLLHVLDDGNQIQNIVFDAYGNMIGNEKLKAFKSEQNAFTRYEIDRYIFLRSEISIVLDGDENGRLL